MTGVGIHQKQSIYSVNECNLENLDKFENEICNTFRKSHIL